MRHVTAFVLVIGSVLLAAPAHAVVTTYIDEAAYLNDLQALGYVAVQEGFEGAAWTLSRSPGTAPNVTSMGVTWTSNNSTSEVTTGPGPARTGQWGFYSIPHGDFDQHNPPAKDCSIPNTCGDGFAGTSATPLFGVGGWLESNTQQAKIELLIDGVPVDFGAACDPDNCIITALHRFFGVIDTAGFTSFTFNETEGTVGDQEFIFADDFTFATSVAIPALSEWGIIVFSGLALGFVVWHARRRRGVVGTP